MFYESARPVFSCNTERVGCCVAINLGPLDKHRGLNRTGSYGVRGQWHY